MLFLDNSISDSSDCFYIGSISDFLSQIFHMRIDGSVVEIMIISDNLFHECFPFDYMVFVFHEICKNKKFCFCCLNNITGNL